MIKKHKSHHSGKVSLRRKRSQRKRSQRKRSQRKRSQRKSQRRDGMEESKKTTPDEVPEEVPKEFKELKAKIDEVNREKKKILGEFPDKIHDVEAFMERHLCEYEIVGIILKDKEGDKTTLIKTIKGDLEENEIEKMANEMANEMKAEFVDFALRGFSGLSDRFGNYPKTMARHDEMFKFIDNGSYLVG
jgi:hypothetical protein